MIGKVRMGATTTGSPVGQLVHPGHAHELRQAVDLGRARPALARLAVPPAREVGRWAGLDAVDDVEDDLALDRGHDVLGELRRPGRRPATPAWSRRRPSVLSSSKSSCSSAGISSSGSGVERVAPRRVDAAATRLTLPNSGSGSG